MRVKYLAAIGIAAGVAVFLSLWFDGRERHRTLRVGFSQFAPYLMDSSSGEPHGLAAEVMTEAARRAKVAIRWVKVGDIDEALQRKTIDVYPLAVLTAARKARLHVSEPWWENEIVLTSSNSDPLQTAAGTAGKRVGVRGLLTIEQLAASLFPSAHRIRFSRIEDMLPSLCAGEIDAFFLDLRLLQSQLLKGGNVCRGQGLHVASIPKGSFSLGTLAQPDVARAADGLFEQIAQLSADGTLTEAASRWSVYNAYASRHVRDTLDAQHRAELMRYGLLGAIICTALIGFHMRRMRRARLLAEASNGRFDAFMRYMPAVAYIKDVNGRISFVNDSFSRTFDKAPAQFIGKTDYELWSPEIAVQFRKNDAEVLSSSCAQEVLETAVCDDGESHSFLSYKFPFRHPSGEQFLGGISIDITERLRAEEALKLSQFSIDCSQDTMLWIDYQGKIFNANLAACRNLGYEREELIGMHVSEIDPYLTRDAFCDSREDLKKTGTQTIESAHRRKNGSTFPVEIHQNLLIFNGAEYSCCMCRDITERKLAEEELARQARHDALTGLPNRRLLDTQLARAVEAARIADSEVAVLFLDLDGFKLVNDTLGHEVGDHLLRQVAGRLQKSLRFDDMLFRMGGDEFTAVLTGNAGPAAAAAVAGKLLGSLQEPFSVEGHHLSITSSLGISLFPHDGAESGALLRNADAAMYEAKRQGKNRTQFFRPENRTDSA